MIIDPLRIQSAARRFADENVSASITRLNRKVGVVDVTAAQVEQRRRALLSQSQDAATANTRLERILGGNELSDINYLSRGVSSARSVGRVIIRSGEQLQGYGTGFLVAPGVIMTNRHVLESPQVAASSSIQFRYERDAAGRATFPAEFALRADPEPIIDAALDVALISVEPLSRDGNDRLDQFGWLKLNPDPGKAFIGEFLTIIQHPNGERKQVCVRENRLLKYDENGPFLWYQTDTVGGSSGSPVFNNTWDVVALHHSGVPRTKRVGKKDVWLTRDGKPWHESMGDDTVDWIANEGVRISRILAFLSANFASHSIARAILDAVPAPALESAPAGSVGTTRRVESDGTLRVTVPIEIGIKVGSWAGAAMGGPAPGSGGAAPVISGDPARAAPPIPAATPDAVARVIEKVLVNQDTYNLRPGYDPKFLGPNLEVPLPTFPPALAKDILRLKDGSTQLKYWNYSVVMSRSRSLPFFAAANIDPASWKGNRDADGDTWYRDTRVDEIGRQFQIGDEFYARQSKFEARDKTPFDRGHLARRSDLQWGPDAATAKRNGDDSYHWTNCTPQHWQFNENKAVSGLWFRLEEHAAHNLSKDGKLCMINGSIFDAPLSTKGPDGRYVLNPKGKRSPDPVFGPLKIPKQFYKLAVWAASGKLRCAAFVVTQEDLLATTARLRPSEATGLTAQELRLYQVPVTTLEKLSGLKFGSLSKADTSSKPQRLDPS